MAEHIVNEELVDLAISARECPECKFVPGSHGSHAAFAKRLTNHLRSQHNIISGRTGRGRAATLQSLNGTGLVKGESIVLGPVPTQPTKILVRNGTASREITVHILPMAEIVDVISSAIRQVLLKRGLA